MPEVRRSFALMAALLLFAAPASAGKLFLSTQGDATLPGLSFGDGDGVIFDPDANDTTLVLDETSFLGGNEDIVALHLDDDGSILLSTQGDATLGGLAFGDDDVVRYDPNTDTATLVFDGGALFSNGNEDIDAVSVLSNGNLLLSTTNGANLGGLDFLDGDLVEYDLGTDTASLYFSESLFSGGEDIDGAHAYDDGTLLITTQTDATLGGLSFGDDDVVLYDPGTDTAFLFFDGGATFSNAGEDVNAVSVREAPLLALLMAPLLLVVIRRR